MKIKKSKMFPSQIKYLKKNPIVSCHIPAAQKEELNQLALKKDMSLSQLIQSILLNSLKEEKKEDIDMVKHMVKEYHVEVNARDKFGESSLTIASRRRNINLIDFLIEEGVDIDTKNNRGNTALIDISGVGDTETMKYLVDKHGADINMADDEGWTALMAASFAGNLDHVDFLFKSGANVEAVDKKGWTALTLATERGHLHVVRYLVKNGANVIRVYENVGNALTVAAKVGNIPLLKCLTNHIEMICEEKAKTNKEYI